MNGTPRRGPVTREALFSSFNELIASAESHYMTFDGYQAQDVLRPVDAAIREAQRLVYIATEKKHLAEQLGRLSGMQDSIAERKKKIAELENT